MKITKFGHCCLLIEENGIRILTDPGSYSTVQNEIKNIDIVLITHEHGDHLHIDSLKTLLQNNPNVKIITNKSVGVLLDKENIQYTIIEDGESSSELGILIEGFGKDHAIVYKTVPVQNTGYFVDNKFYYPGDSFTNPNKQVEILALPVAGPWMKLSEAIDYALYIKAKVTFPMHDGILKDPTLGSSMTNKVLTENGLKFEILDLDKEYTF
ncbi:MAG: MBL fold metallo-hydrolase [Candidatus Dojkabacteria bacterium]